MNDPSAFLWLFGFQNLKGLLMGLSIMNHDGKTKLFAQLNLFPKSFQLDIARREISIEIEANFSISPHPVICTEFSQRGIGLLIDLPCIMGMDTQDRINRMMGMGNLKSSVPILLFRTHCEDVLHTRGFCPLNDFFQIAPEVRHLQMGMRIDEHIR